MILTKIESPTWSDTMYFVNNVLNPMRWTHPIFLMEHNAHHPTLSQHLRCDLQPGS